MPVLVDPHLDRSLRADGYVTTPLLRDDEVAELLAWYQELRPSDDRGLTIDYLRRDRSYIEAVEERLRPIWERCLDQLFDDHRVAIATFVNKHPGDDSAMLLHEEPSFVDERAHRSHALWIPLVDVAPELDNGHLLLLPQSHRLERGPAGFNTPVQHRPYEEQIWPRLTAVRASAGDAVIYDSRTLHGSVANRSTHERLAIAASVVPRQAHLVHVVATGRRGRRLHAVPDDFYVRCSPESFEPLELDAPILAEIEDPQALHPDALEELLGVAVPEHPLPIVPADVAAAIAEPGSGALPRTRRPATAPEHDLAVALDHRAPVATARTVVLGPVHRAGLVRSEQLPAEARRAASAMRPRGALRHDILVLEPGGRAEFEVPRSRWHRTLLTTIDSPMVNAGITSALGGAELVPGERLRLGAARYATWNEGPGSAVVLLSTSIGRTR